jgi:hypothetical protein
LDITCVLAALQEEAGESYKKLESSYSSKSGFRNLLPLPAPLRDKPSLPSVVDDKRGMEASRASISVDANAQALRNYRKSIGVMFQV